MFKRQLSLIILAAAALSCAPAAMAQAITTDSVRVTTAGPGKVGTMAVRIDGMDATPVKGSPFCATVVTEHTQTFADGNRIHTTENSVLCRDSEGRTRREAQLNLLGAVPQGTASKMITIVDPVAGVRYSLDPTAKIARKMSLPAMLQESGTVAAGAGTRNVMVYSRSGAPEGLPPAMPGTAVFIDRKVISAGGSDTPPITENLGDQTINGIHATGTRVTTTIPAGQMGNEQPINVVSEDWYSPELKVMVMTKHTDPWAGQLTTQFANVNTSEPDSSLFTIPSDYRVVDEKDAGPFMIKIKPPVTP